MRELLRLCGFEADEAESELPRIEKAFQRIGITAGDMERGRQRLTRYYDVELKGVRKIMRLLVQGVVNLVLAREEGKSKIVYGFMAPGITTFNSLLVSRSEEVYAANLCQPFQWVVGCIFDKIVPILEEAEKRWLKAGAVAHCGNVKTLVGLLALDLIPSPDLLVTSGYLCETAPKTIDILHALSGLPTYCYDTCQDRDFGEHVAATRRIAAFAAKSMRRFTARLEETLGFEITDDMLREAMAAKEELGRALHRLQSLIEKSDPLLLSPTHQILWICLDAVPLPLDRIAEAVDAVNTLYEELQERAAKGIGVLEKGAPRILALLPSHYADPRLDHLVGETGIAIASTDIFFASDAGGSEDPYERMALGNLPRSMYTSLKTRIPLILEGCTSLKVDGVLDRFHVGCRTVAGDALAIKEAITKELGIPVLLLERDDFDPRSFNHEQDKRRLEVFKSMLVNRSG